jgi:hypothetical protein
MYDFILNLYSFNVLLVPELPITSLSTESLLKH